MKLFSQQNKKPKLTSNEEIILDQLRSLNGVSIRKHMDPNGTMIYRLLDERINPIMNINRKCIDGLIAKERIQVDFKTYENNFRILPD